MMKHLRNNDLLISWQRFFRGTTPIAIMCKNSIVIRPTENYPILVGEMANFQRYTILANNQPCARVSPWPPLRDRAVVSERDIGSVSKKQPIAVRQSESWKANLLFIPAGGFTGPNNIYCRLSNSRSIGFKPEQRGTRHGLEFLEL
jgi:hypothetical protein